MKKFKVNEKGFLDSSYNFEGIKKQYQDEIARSKSKLNDFQEGTDYTVSYEGQKKVYTIHSPQLKKVYWGDNIPNGFEYLIEEDNEGVRTRMKMIGSLGIQTSYQGDNVQRNVEGNSSNRIPSANHEDIADKISSLKKELQQKEEDVKRLANYPKKQENIRVEIENIKTSIRELTEQQFSEESDVEMTNAKNNFSFTQQNNRRDGRGGSNNFAYWGIGIISFLGLIGIVVASKKF